MLWWDNVTIAHAQTGRSPIPPALAASLFTMFAFTFTRITAMEQGIGRATT